MIFTELGIVMDVNEEQPMNTPFFSVEKLGSPNVINPSFRFISLKDTQLTKARSRIVVKLSGKTIDSSFVQPSKAPRPILVIPSEIVISSIFVAAKA